VTDGPAGVAAPVTTRLVEVDLGEGAVASSRELPANAEATVVRDTLVIGAEQDGAFLLVGSNLTDGAERWRTEVPDLISASGSSGWLTSGGDHVFVLGAAGTWAVDPTDGRVQAREDSLYTGRSDALVGIPSTGGMRTRLLGEDGAGTATVEGYPLYVSPDDGSAPAIQPVSAPDGAGSVLRGIDSATGDVRWERRAEIGPRSHYLLLDGVLYGSDPTTVWAVDAETGAERWAMSAAPVEERGLMTDGRHLLRTELESDSGELVLSAYALGTGRRAWTTPVPEEVQALWSWQGVLFGYSDDGQEMFRLR
jgi:outer membrane protein assembly factor BamB